LMEARIYKEGEKNVLAKKKKKKKWNHEGGALSGQEGNAPSRKEAEKSSKRRGKQKARTEKEADFCVSRPRTLAPWNPCRKRGGLL